MVEQAMKDPRFQVAQKNQIEDATRKAFDAFLLISVDYLYRVMEQGKEDIIKYTEFVVEQMKYVQNDADYFKLLNEAISDEIGVNILKGVVMGGNCG